MKILRDIEIIQILRGHGFKDLVGFAPNDRSYLEIDLDWFKSKFIPYHLKKSLPYAKYRWNCFKQAWQAKNMIHEIHAQSHSGQGAAAFGIFGFIPEPSKIPPNYDPLDGHEICFLINNEQVHYYDSTRMSMVDLSPDELGSVDSASMLM